MPATLLPTEVSKISAITEIQGASPAVPDTSNGNEFVNTGRELLVIVSAGASAATLTLTPLAKLNGALPVASPTYSIGASKTVILGPFDPGTYNGNTSGSVAATSGARVAVSWSGVSGTVNVYVVQAPDARQVN